MKKSLFTILLFIGFIQFSNAQISYGIKSGVNYNNTGDATVSTLGTDVVDGAKAKAGFHAGLWLKGKIPVLGLYIRPELVYTQLKSEYTYQSRAIEYDLKKIDVPVLVGKKFFGVMNAFIGPSFQYIIDDTSFANLSSIKTDEFSLGLQMGLGVEIGKVGVDVRWERGLSDTESSFIDVDSSDITVDNRSNQIIFGLSYKF